MKTRRGWNVGLRFFTVTFGKSRTTELLAPRSDRTLPPRKLLATHFCWRLNGL